MSRNTIKVEVAGLSEVRAALASFGVDIEKAVGQAVEATAIEIASDVKRSIQRGPKTGEIYRRGKGGKIVHQASRAGEPPATDTGALVSSVYYISPSYSEAIVGSRLEYAEYLELGTKHIEKRPSWVPAVLKNAPRLQKRVERIIREAKARGERTTK